MSRLLFASAVVLGCLTTFACVDSRRPTITRVDDSPAKIPARIGQVNDFVGLTSDDSRAKLEERLSRFKSSSGIDVVIVTLPSRGGRAIEDHAMDIANQWKLASRDPSNGEVLLDILVDDGEFRTQVSKPLWDKLPNDDLDKLQQRLTEQFSNGSYEVGINEWVDTIQAKLTTTKGTEKN